MKIAFYTLGCKVNQYETAEMSALLSQHGWLNVGIENNPDVIVVNSCTVTAESDRKTRQSVRHMKKTHPDSIIVLTGCMPQAFPEDAAALKEADIVIGNRLNAQLPRILEEYFSDRRRTVNIQPHLKNDCFRGEAVSEFPGHTRASLKIQDGCNRRCSYCTIPAARGFSRSKALDDIKSELSSIAGNGYKEVVFVGINLSNYGRDIALSLCDAVEAAENTPGIERIRLGSLEPDHITPEMIQRLHSCRKFCPQFHISLQSGSDSVLARMNRHYNSAEYFALAEKLRAGFSDCTLTTDIICGFPGESEEEFLETVEFAKKTAFEKVHIFPYSRRVGTRAAELPGQITNEVKARRCAQLGEVCELLRGNFLLSQKDKILEVLFETPKDGIQEGYTKNYTPVSAPCGTDMSGKIARVLVTGVEDDRCFGIIVEQKPDMADFS